METQIMNAMKIIKSQENSNVNKANNNLLLKSYDSKTNENNKNNNDKESSISNIADSNYRTLPNKETRLYNNINTSKKEIFNTENNNNEEITNYKIDKTSKHYKIKSIEKALGLKSSKDTNKLKGVLLNPIYLDTNKNEHNIIEAESPPRKSTINPEMSKTQKNSRNENRYRTYSESNRHFNKKYFQEGNNKINTEENKPKQKSQPIPSKNAKHKKKSDPFVVKQDITKEMTSGLTCLSYSVLIFTLFGAKKPKGRTSDFYKNNANYNHNPQHSKNNLDNFKLKAIRGCFKEIGMIIYSLCLAFGKQYQIKKLNKKDKIKSNEEIIQFCDKKMADLFANSNSRNIKANSPNLNHNRRIYDRLVLEDKINQSPLLARILDMSFGEILYKFINDDNFTKKIDPNYNFRTFSEIYGKQYSDELIENTQQNLRKLLGVLYV
jgi:hypothetical protein